MNFFLINNFFLENSHLEFEQSFLMEIFAIFESTKLQGWEFHFNKLFCNLSFMKISKKSQKSLYLLNKNDLGILKWRPNLQPLRLLVQPPNYRLGISNFMRNFFEKKITKNVISGKLQDFEQSYLEAKFLTPESTLTEPHYRDENFKFCETFYTWVYWKILKKPKNRKISKTTKIWAATWRGKIRNPLRLPSQIPITGLRSSKFWNFLTFKFF